MFRHLFRNRLFICGLICVLSIVMGSTLYLRHVQRQTDEALETTTPATGTQPIQKSETPPVETQPSEEQETDTSNVVPNDSVEMAWQRLDYISENIYEWGGIPSPKAPPLMEKLTPVKMSADHAEAELRSDLLDELAVLRDPRSVEIIVKSMCEGGIWGTSLEEALIAIGPPAVPYLIPYLDTEARRADVAAEVLGYIGKQYGSELGGAVEHIILPKLRTLFTNVSDKESEHFDPYTAEMAQAAINRLRK